MIIQDTVKVQGFLEIRYGEAFNVKANDNGEICDWDFKQTELCKKQNKICLAGWQFANSYGWNNIGVVIAIGNGMTSGADAPKDTDVKLKSELFNGRFICVDSKARIQNNLIIMSALWARGQGYINQVTEWGLFANLRGQNLTTKDSGNLISRIALNFTRGATQDVELNWIINFNT